MDGIRAEPVEMRRKPRCARPTSSAPPRTPTRPFVLRERLRPGTHVNSVGYDSAGQGEVDAELVRRRARRRRAHGMRLWPRHRREPWSCASPLEAGIVSGRPRLHGDRRDRVGPRKRADQRRRPHAVQVRRCRGAGRCCGGARSRRRRVEPEPARRSTSLSCIASLRDQRAARDRQYWFDAVADFLGPATGA